MALHSMLAHGVQRPLRLDGNEGSGCPGCAAAAAAASRKEVRAGKLLAFTENVQATRCTEDINLLRGSGQALLSRRERPAMQEKPAQQGT